MANPFAGIITSGLKTLHKNMIDALLEDAACTIACTVYYQGSQYDDIPGTNNPDPIGNKPPGIHIHGGPRFGPPRKDVTVDQQTETIYLMPVWDMRQWIQTPLASTLINNPDGFLQTLSKITTLVTLKRADQLVVDTDLEAKVRHTYTRAGEPEPCGFGASTHIITMWKRIG